MKELLLFTAPWCEPCKSVKPIFRDLATDYPNINFEVIDVEEEPKLTRAMKVRSVPYLALIDDGQVVDYFVNPVTEANIRGLIDANNFV